MKKVLSLVLIFALVLSLFTLSVISFEAKANGSPLVRVKTIGVMPDDYIGAINLSTANMYENDFKSMNAFPQQGMAVTPDGDIAICDTSYGRIHILSSDLKHKKVFGELGLGDGKMQHPSDVAVDKDGDFYVADFLNNVFIKFDKDGKFIYQVGGEGKSDGQFMGPAGIAVTDDGFVYVSDQLNGRIQKFNIEGKFVKTIGGISNPGGMGLGKDGAVYFVNTGLNKIFKIVNDAAVEVFGVSGAGDDKLTFPSDIAFDAAGNFYISDRGLGKTRSPGIKVFDPTGKFIKKIGTPSKTTGLIEPLPDGAFLTPAGVAVISDSVYVFDAGYFYSAGNPFGNAFAPRLSVFGTDGVFKSKIDYLGLVQVGSQDKVDNFTTIPGRLMDPQGAAVDEKGQIWVTSAAYYTDWPSSVEIFDASGNHIKTITKFGTKKLLLGSGVIADQNGKVYVSAADSIGIFDTDGNFLKEIGVGKIAYGRQLAFDSQGNIWVGSDDDLKVIGFNPENGSVVGQFNVADNPYGLAIDSKGIFYIVGPHDNVCYAYSKDGTKVATLGVKGGGRTEKKFWIPEGVAVAPDGNILIADTENGRIQAFKPDGTFVWSTPRFTYEPVQMNWGPDGLLYVADCLHNTVNVFSYGEPPAKDYAVQAKGTPTSVDIKAGEKAEFTITISNTGNKDDGYNIVVKETFPAGWTSSISQTSVDVGVGASLDIKASITSPSTALAGEKGTIAVTITSKSDSKISATVILSAKIPEKPPVLVGSDPVTGAVGAEFNVTISVFDVTSLYGSAFEIKYDSEKLELVKVTQGTFLGDNVLFLEDHSTKGKIVVGYTLKGIAAGISGSGSLLVITFKGKTEGETTVEIQNLVLKDPKGEVISSKSKNILVKLATPKPPALVTNLKNMEIKEKTLTVTGKTDVGAKVTINGKDVTVKADGTFTYTLSLSEGANKITVVATNQFGLSTTLAYTITVKTTVVIILQIGNKIMTVNGQSQELDSPPVIIEGRTLVPIRAIVEAIGGSISWDGVERKVTINLGTTTIELWIGKNTAKVNGVSKPIDAANPKVVPQIISGRTMLPLRFVAENLGCKVDWEGTTKTITLIYPAP